MANISFHSNSNQSPECSGFSTGPHFKHRCSKLHISFLSVYARVYAIIYCCMLVCTEHLFYIECHIKKRKSRQTERNEKTKSVRFHQNKSYGWKNSHRNGNRILSRIYENYFLSESTLNIQAEHFSFNRWGSNLSPINRSTMFSCAVTFCSIYFLVLFSFSRFVRSF